MTALVDDCSWVQNIIRKWCQPSANKDILLWLEVGKNESTDCVCLFLYRIKHSWGLMKHDFAITNWNELTSIPMSHW